MPSVTRRTQPNRQQRRAAIEQRLLTATEQLMRAGAAFTELSVDRLAEEAGISRATFYVYFEDKGQLLNQLAGQAFVELADAANTWWEVIERHDPMDARAAMAEIIASYRRRQALLSAVIEMAAYDASVAETYQQLISGIVDRFVAVIERGQADGSIRPLPVRATAVTLTWMVERTVHQTVRITPPETDEDLADVFAEIIWSTLYLEPALADRKSPSDPG